MTDNGLSPHSQEILAIALEQAREGSLPIGGLQNLFSFHESQFGNSVMTAPEGEGSGDSGGDDPDDDGGSGSADDDPDDGRDPKAKIKALAEEKDRHYKKFQTEKQRADDLAARLKEIEEAGLEEHEKVAKKAEELEKSVASLSEENTNLKLENAFLTDNTYSWHNPKRALKLVDLSEVEITDDGSVKGLDTALKNLAKSDPYLIKTEEPKDDTKPPKTGHTPNPAKTEKTPDADRERLVQKYPGLRR